MTNDLISREALLDAMPKDDELFSLDVRRVILNAPTVDAAPVVHGRWIQNKTVPSYHFCSNCKRAHDMPKSCNFYVLPFYCPNCGAKMDKEADNAQE